MDFEIGEIVGVRNIRGDMIRMAVINDIVLDPIHLIYRMRLQYPDGRIIRMDASDRLVKLDPEFALGQFLLEENDTYRYITPSKGPN